MKERLSVIETKVGQIESEIILNRKFKHDTNDHLQNHAGKMTIIEIQHLTTAESIDKLTGVVESALVKIGNIMNIKFMLVGGAAVGTVMAGGILGALKLWMDFHK